MWHPRCTCSSPSHQLAPLAVNRSLAGGATDRQLRGVAPPFLSVAARSLCFHGIKCSQEHPGPGHEPAVRTLRQPTVQWLDEPELAFAAGMTHIDLKVGIPASGP